MTKKELINLLKKNHSSSEKEKSQDGEREDPETKKRSQSKRAKIEDVDSKIKYEISRRKLVQKLQENRESFGFSGSKDEERVNEKDSNRKTPLRVKSNEEVFEMIQTHEIFSESDCSEIEENKAEFVTTIMDLFDIYNEDGDSNCLFRAISRLTYGAPDHHKEIRETVCDYIATRYDRFSNFILWDINDYS